jgi:hypothetical protein
MCKEIVTAGQRLFRATITTIVNWISVLSDDAPPA